MCASILYICIFLFPSSVVDADDAALLVHSLYLKVVRAVRVCAFVFLRARQVSVCRLLVLLCCLVFVRGIRERVYAR